MPAGDAGGVVGPLPTTPTFVLPYKRYATPSLLRLAAGYLQDDRTSYRKAVRSANLPLGYQTAAGAPAIDERALSHVTLWRWLTWLGSQLAGLRLAREMILQREPASTCHRFIGDVAPTKFRSPQRQSTLRHARQLLHAIDEWKRVFCREFFPRFATRSGFG